MIRIIKNIFDFLCYSIGLITLSGFGLVFVNNYINLIKEIPYYNYNEGE